MLGYIGKVNDMTIVHQELSFDVYIAEWVGLYCAFHQIIREANDY